MTKNHMKRINAPKRWDILRKGKTFVSRPNPGRNMELALALNTSLKDMLGKTQTTKETKYLLKNKGVNVNGVRRYDDKFPVGFLDVLSIPALNESYRLVVNDHDRLEFVSIPESESNIKISKVANKVQLPGGKLQINCTDGRNFLMDAKVASDISTNDAILYSVPDQKVKETFKLAKGALVFLYKGRHIGLIVKVDDFKAGNIVFTHDGQSYETKKSYAFAIGKDKPAITVQSHKKKSAEHAAEPHAAKKHKKDE